MSLDTAISKPTPHALSEASHRTSVAPGSANEAVIAAIRSHHAELAAQLRTRTDAVLGAARVGDCAAAREQLQDWYRTELMPHVVAEEQALYGPASGLAATRLLICGMLAEHRALVSIIASLGLSATDLEVATTAAAAQAVFTVHLSKENDLLLPALDQAGLNLTTILAGMHEILGHGQADEDAHGGCGCGCEHDGAEQGAVPVQIGSRPTSPADEADELDVRTLPHGQRHEIIFAKLDQLQPGQSLVIVNDHDPKPLRYQTAALWPDRFDWTYREAGPQRWLVAITRAG